MTLKVYELISYCWSFLTPPPPYVEKEVQYLDTDRVKFYLRSFQDSVCRVVTIIKPAIKPKLNIWIPFIANKFNFIEHLDFQSS